MGRRTATDSGARRMRRHLELAPEVEEWPDDLLTLLGQARQGYLADEPMPQPSAAVAAFMQVPAHGIAEVPPLRTPTLVEHDVEPEEIELSLISSPGSPAAPHVRRPLVALGGAAAAILLVALGLRPMLGVSATEAEQQPSTSIASQPTTSSTVPDGDRDGPTTPTTAPPTTVPVTPPVTVPAVPAPAEPTPSTPATPAPSAPATTAKATKPTTTKKPPVPATTVKPAPAPAPVAPAPTPPPTLAPAVGTTSREAVLRYYDLANTRGKCVAKQPKGATRAQLVAACGAEPIPPANLVQFWAAKDNWGRCADPLLAKGWKQSKVEASCGAKPDRSTYDVPPNPYA